MKHMAWGAVALLGAASLAGCYSYASDAVNNHNFNTVQATPNFSVVKVGDSDQVIVRLVNDNNNGATTSYTISNVGSGIAVHYVATYRPIYDAGSDTLVNTTDKNAQEYYIVGQALGRYSFKITPTSVNTGVSATVNVLVEPKTLFTALNKHTAAPGDTVTVTAPAGLVFSQASAVTFASGTPVTIVGRSADSSAITFIVGGNITGPASVTLVSQPTAPNVAPVTLATGDSLVTTPIPNPVPVTVSLTSADFGTPITVTLNGGLRFLRNSTVSVGQLPATLAQIIGPDSTSAIIFPAPGSNDSIAFTNIALSAYAPAPARKTAADTISAGAFASKGDKVLHVAAPANVPTTLSTATPGIGAPVTVALGGGFRFLNSSHIFVGGIEGGIQSVSADSSTATFVPMANGSGAVTFTNIAPSGAPKATIALPSDGKTITPTGPYAGPTDPNSSSPTAASTVTVTGTRSTVISDNGAPTTSCSAIYGSGATCRYYKYVSQSTSTSMSVNINWNASTTTDLALYIDNAANTGCAFGAADGAGPVAGNVGYAGPTVTCNFSATAKLAASTTYLLTVVNFGPANPAWYQVRISQP
ncbi:MAG TPA: hypothetical protein VGM77_03055 [Gemmatimonadales bacterium]|jgi:hypothetical protein